MTDTQYEDSLKILEKLMNFEPEPDTALGILLNVFADRIALHEKLHWDI